MTTRTKNFGKHFRRFLFALLVCVGFAFSALAQQSAIINYQGRITRGGANFIGDGFFVFSIHDSNGMILWSSGEFPHVGSTNLPPGAWKLTLRDGVYNIRLGDRGAGMPALDTATLNAAAAPRLRIWFNDGQSGWTQLPEDVSIGNAVSGNVKNSAAANPTAGNAMLTAAQGEAILRELRDLRAAMQKQPAPQPAPAPQPPQIVTVPISGSPSLGSNDAPLVLVEFTDFQCPFCKRAHDDAFPALEKKFVETGKLRIVSRNLPLSFHANAEPAAHAALCAMQQNKFWPMRDRLFAMNTTLFPTNFLKAAAELNLDTNLFASCLNGKAFATQLAKDAADAQAAGITGTPSFVLGKLADGKVTGTLIIGSKPSAFFESEVEKLLAAKQ